MNFKSNISLYLYYFIYFVTVVTVVTVKINIIIKNNENKEIGNIERISKMGWFSLQCVTRYKRLTLSDYEATMKGVHDDVPKQINKARTRNDCKL